MVERVVDSQVPGSECVSMHVCVRICVHVHVHVRVCVCACVCVGNVKCGAEARVEWSLEEGSKLFIHSDNSPLLEPARKNQCSGSQRPSKSYLLLEHTFSSRHFIPALSFTSLNSGYCHQHFTKKAAES